jgi:hypothetical protein
MKAKIVWPHEMLVPAKVIAHPVGRSVEGAMPLSGGAPGRVVFGRGGVWIIALVDVMLHERVMQAVWKALRAQQKNGSVPIIVPYMNSWLRAQPLGTAPLVPFSDGATFTDGAMFETRSIWAQILEDADHGATELRIRVLNAAPFIGAEPFSINHSIADWRLYETASVLEAEPVGGGFDYLLEFGPPLRQRVRAGEEVDFDLPRCVVKLMDADGMQLEEQQVVAASVTFVEDMSALEGLPEHAA